MRRRNGFTIVELLVAMALIMFIMAILSQAFVAATSTFRSLKATGDMANKLRSVTTLLQRDLAADHFEGKKRLSNPKFWVNGPPEQGFFRIWQGSAGILEGYDQDVTVPKGPGIGSYRSVDHALAFTIKVRGDQMGDFLTAGQLGGGATLGTIAQVGPAEARYQAANNYNFQWGDIAWYMQPQIDPNTNIQDTTLTDPVAGTQVAPLFTLYRSQRLAVPDNTLVPAQAANKQSQFLQISCWPNGGNLYFNSPMDLTVPARRFGVDPTNPAGMLYATVSNPASLWPQPPPGSTWIRPAMPPPAYPPSPPRAPYYPTLAQQSGGALSGADIQLTDVVSFDVRVLTSDTTSYAPDPFVTLFDPAFANYNTFYTIVNMTPVPHPTNPNFYSAAANPLAPAVFDTWTSLTDAYSNYSQWNQPGQATSIPLWNGSQGPTILAIQITIRIWDVKTNQTREVTLVQAM